MVCAMPRVRGARYCLVFAQHRNAFHQAGGTMTPTSPTQQGAADQPTPRHDAPDLDELRSRPGSGDLDPVTGSASAVVGLQWGDEGKGKVIDLLAGEHDVVVRYNGGANAGHSIVVGGERFAVHLTPSGVLRPGVESVIGNGVVVDPKQLVSELTGLSERGIAVAPPGGEGATLAVSDRAHIVAPYHKAQDRLTEAWLARTGAERIGTTGRGIGPAYADKAGRSLAIRMGDLLDEKRLRERLGHICEYKSALLATLAQGEHSAETEGDFTDAVRPEVVFAELSAAGRALAPMICDTVDLLHRRLREGKKILFEGANATLLDIDHGTFPFVTSSSTASSGIPSGSGVPGALVRTVIGVMKAYGTRVGSGPFPSEQDNAVGDAIREAGHEYGTTTGRPRRCGFLDLVAARYAVRVNGVTSLAVMLLDVLSGIEPLRVCTGYRLPDGTVTERFIPDAEKLGAVEPVWTELEPFGGDVTGVTRLDDLPSGARAYLSFIERFVGAPVSIVSVGPGREQTIRVV
jgi:adenylosuccinate synthase